MEASRITALAVATTALFFACPRHVSAQACGSEVQHHKLDAGTSPAPALRAPDGAAVVGGPFYDAIFFATDADGCSPPLAAVDPVDTSLCGGFAVFQAGVFDPAAQGGVAR